MSNGEAQPAVPAVGGHDSGPVLESLPPSTRRELLLSAAACLDVIPTTEVPPALRRVRSFAPARRPVAGAAPLTHALEADPAFRHRVAAAWREAHPEWAHALDDGVRPETAREVDVVCGLYLLRPPGWGATVASVLADVDDERRRRATEQEVARRDADLARLGDEMERLRLRIRALERDLTEAAAERDTLRKEMRRHRSDADRARASAKRAEEDLSREVAARSAAQQEAEAAARERDEARARAAAEQDEHRRHARLRQELDEVRARLLLDTLVDAAAGLRRELALPPAVSRPADVVAEGVASGEGVTGRPAHAVPVEEPSLLEQWLALPQAHLVVDGYNVTKTAHPQRSLAEQRRWLVEGLVALAARTGAEVTCCFDGVAVHQEPGVVTRGVRVLFSGAGVEADELIRRLVRAEPEGRPVVVASSDAAVARGVVAAGARSAAAIALVRFLGR